MASYFRVIASGCVSRASITLRRTVVGKSKATGGRCGI